MPLTEHATVMHLDEERSSERNEEIFYTNDDGESDLVEDFKMDWDVYVRMGRPQVITINVRPFDALNTEEGQHDVVSDITSGGHQVGNLDV